MPVRTPGRRAGSGTAPAANLVTCAIGEETVVSVRWPAAVNSIVGLAPTKELVSTDGMIGAGLNMRVGPMCRTVADTARILDVIAGYDPKDEFTAHSVGRTPRTSYLEATNARSLAGLRIGVVRETLAITAYAIGDFALALRELRTYRRLTGHDDQLPLMVDSERGVGRPDRALELGRSVDRTSLPASVQAALAIAMSGARLDLGQPAGRRRPETDRQRLTGGQREQGRCTVTRVP